MSADGHNSADARLRSFIDRVLRLKEEQDTISDDIREVYAEAKGEGYDKTAMGALVAHLRKVDKKGADAINEAETVFGLYLDAYQRATGMVVATHAHTHEKLGPDAGQVRTTSPLGAGTPVEAGNTPAGSVSDAIPSTNTNRGGNGPATTGAAADEAITPSAPVNHSEDGFRPESLSFLRKTPADYRPNCQHPDNCASSGLNHCYQCRKALEAVESEVA